jgi:hypothetical protein
LQLQPLSHRDCRTITIHAEDGDVKREHQGPGNYKIFDSRLLIIPCPKSKFLMTSSNEYP